MGMPRGLGSIWYTVDDITRFAATIKVCLMMFGLRPTPTEDPLRGFIDPKSLAATMQDTAMTHAFVEEVAFVHGECMKARVFPDKAGDVKRPRTIRGSEDCVDVPVRNSACVSGAVLRVTAVGDPVEL